MRLEDLHREPSQQRRLLGRRPARRPPRPRASSPAGSARRGTPASRCRARGAAPRRHRPSARARPARGRPRNARATSLRTVSLGRDDERGVSTGSSSSSDHCLAHSATISGSAASQSGSCRHSSASARGNAHYLQWQTASMVWSIGIALARRVRYRPPGRRPLSDVRGDAGFSPASPTRSGRELQGGSSRSCSSS